MPDSCRSREADRGEEGRRHIASLRNSLLFGAVVTLHLVDVTFKNTYDITSTNDDCMYINMYHISEKIRMRITLMELKAILLCQMSI